MIFLNLIETIARMRDIKVFMLANPANIYTNPYFLYFGLSLPFNNDIKLFKDNLILLQYMKNEEYREEKRKTKFRPFSCSERLLKIMQLIIRP